MAKAATKTKVKTTVKGTGGAIKLYGTYSFVDKDPAIDRLRTKFRDSGFSIQDASVASGVSASTITNWFGGATRRPQFATLNAVARAVGFQFSLIPISGRK